MTDSWQASRHRKTKKARDLRRNMTDAETRLWRELRRFPGFSFRRQHPIGPYFADFCCLPAKLVIEVDGGQHSAESDAERSAYIEGKDFRILRFWNNEVLQNIGGVTSSLLDVLTPSAGGTARRRR